MSSLALRNQAVDTRYDYNALVAITVEMASDRKNTIKIANIQRDAIDKIYLDITSVLESIHDKCREELKSKGSDIMDLTGIRRDILKRLEDLSEFKSLFDQSNVYKIIELSRNAVEKLHASYTIAMIRDIQSELAKVYIHFYFESDVQNDHKLQQSGKKSGVPIYEDIA